MYNSMYNSNSSINYHYITVLVSLANKVIQSSCSAFEYDKVHSVSAFRFFHDITV